MKMAFVVVLYELTRLHADMLHLLHMSTPLMISPLMKSLWWELTDCRMKNDNFVITNSRHFQAKKFSLLAWIITFFQVFFEWLSNINLLFETLIHEYKSLKSVNYGNRFEYNNFYSFYSLSFLVSTPAHPAFGPVASCLLFGLQYQQYLYSILILST